MKNQILEYLGVEESNLKLITVFYYAFLVSGLMSISIGLIVPHITIENNLTYEQTGMLLSAHQMGNVIAILLAGFLPYAIGRKQSTILLGSGVFIGLILMVITRNPIVLIIAFALTGVGKGTMSNVSNVTISEYSTNRTSSMNLLHAIFAVGALFAPVFMFFSELGNFTFRLSALLIGIMSFISIVFIMQSKLSSVPTQKDSNGSWSFLGSYSFWIDSLVLFFYLCVETSIIGWFVIYFKELGILPEAVCNFIQSILWIMIMFGRVFCAKVSKTVDRSKLLLVMAILLTAFFGLLLFSKTAFFAIIALLGIGFTMAGIYPTTLSTMKGSDNTIQVGFLLAFASMGGVFMPKIVGRVADAKGISAGIFMVLLALFLMIVLATLKFILSKRDNAK